MKSMKTVGSREAKNNFGEIIDEAQRGPVTITRNGRPVGGVVNMRTLEKVMEMERREVQLQMRDALQNIAKSDSDKPIPTIEELMEILEAGEEEVLNIFGEEFFQKN